MSYALDLAVEVRQVFATLPVELQEAVLDEFDRIAAAPPDEREVSDAVQTLGGSMHYAFFRFVRDRPTRTLRVTALGHVVRVIGRVE